MVDVFTARFRGGLYSMTIIMFFKYRYGVRLNIVHAPTLAYFRRLGIFSYHIPELI